MLEKLPAVVVAENISNMASEFFISVPELVLAGASAQERIALAPDLVITFGQQVVSKRLKLFLHSLEEPEVRELQDAGPDLKEKFLELSNKPEPDNSFRSLWKEMEDRECKRSEDYLKKADFGNLSALVRILEAAPTRTVVHLGNSAAIRYSQLVRTRKDLQYYSNRGISGIDGSLSSAVGAAMVSERQHLLILGDLSFVYDSNALWNKDFPENLRIVVLNDGGGGIFRLLDGPDRMGFFEEFSVTHHPVSLELLSASFGRKFARATNMEELDKLLPMLWSPGKLLSVLELDTTTCDNPRIFKDLFR
jgi:2-succinyl-5-enolpyruvyl-6-hydroxy-3-cyclohexene-1-carboxylate synthase